MATTRLCATGEKIHARGLKTKEGDDRFKHSVSVSDFTTHVNGCGVCESAESMTNNKYSKELERDQIGR